MAKLNEENQMQFVEMINRIYSVAFFTFGNHETTQNCITFI